MFSSAAASAFSRAAAIHSRTAALPASCTLLRSSEGAIARRGEASPFFEEEKGVAPIFSSILLSMVRSKSSKLAPLGGSGGRGGDQRRRAAPLGSPFFSVAPVLSDLNTSHSGSATFTLLRSGSSAARARRTPVAAALIPVFIPRISALSSGARRATVSAIFRAGSRASSTRCVALGILASGSPPRAGTKP